MKDLIAKIQEAMELEEDNEITAKTRFRELDSWDSLAFMAIVAMIEADYGIEITQEEFLKFDTIGDICNRVLSE